MQIGRKIYLLRKNAGITQEQLAEQLHVSRQTVSKWEAGTNLPDIESAVTISNLFGVSLDELMLDSVDNLTDKRSRSEICRKNQAGEKGAQSKSIEELVRMNRRNRSIILVITAILIFFLGIALGSIFVKKLDHTTSEIEYTLYQYMELEGRETALVVTKAKEPVLLVTEGSYDDGTGKQVSFVCDVYYTVHNKVKSLGTITGAGTAYAIASDWTGIYAAGGHYIERYEIDETNGTLVLGAGVYEIYDTNGEGSYEKEVYGVRSESSEEEFMDMMKNYASATPVHFE